MKVTMLVNGTDLAPPPPPGRSPSAASDLLSEEGETCSRTAAAEAHKFQTALRCLHQQCGPRHVRDTDGFWSQALCLAPFLHPVS